MSGLLTTGEHLRMTFDQLLEDFLGVVGSLTHRDVAIALSKIDATHIA